MAFDHIGAHVSVRHATGEDAGVCTITIDRPPVNALSREVQEELRSVAVAINADDDVRVVVLTGGPKVFAAGADVKQMSQWSAQQAVEEAGPLQSSFDAIAAIRVPVIAQMSGYALGGGLELALCADIRIGDDTVKVGQPEVLLALIPGAGGTQRLTRLIGPGRAKELIFTGRQMAAAEALACGLLNEVVPADELSQRVTTVARGLARSSQAALRAAKRAIDSGADVSLAAGLGIERGEFAALFGHADTARGFASFFEHGPGKADFRHPDKD
ncbi:MAG: enoyl-CoA hydratase/isomerase family protein [Actinobacteria bacterium]|nr:enoyl-CoA hydratase/isomerase family protein [Actinomycetota bacterium]